MKEYDVKINAITSIWTGDEEKKNNSLRETGILGSLRWWYEALVRGLGGYACDPTVEDLKCTLSGKERSEEERVSKICPACNLFGCTGWSRKFKLLVFENDGKPKKDENMHSKEIIFKFIPLKRIDNEEWALLNLTLYLIARYGALGGKTVLKPSDENTRKDKLHHQDYGLIEIIESKLKILPKDQLQKYVRDKSWRKSKQDVIFWASIENFWCVNGKYLSRKDSFNSSFNRVLGRREEKSKANQINFNDNVAKWLAGSQKNIKKVFSFKTVERTFGFINPKIINYDQMKKRLEEVWGKENGWKFERGEEIINLLIKEIEEGLK